MELPENFHEKLFFFFFFLFFFFFKEWKSSPSQKRIFFSLSFLLSPAFLHIWQTLPSPLTPNCSSNFPFPGEKDGEKQREKTYGLVLKRLKTSDSACPPKLFSPH